MKHIKLSNYISWDDNDKVMNMLGQYQDIDLTYDGGIFFKLGVKHNNIKIIAALFEYFNKTQLQDKIIDTIEYKLAKHKISTILQDAVNSFDISEEMQKVLTPYLPQEDNTDSQDDVSDIDATTGNDNVLWDGELHGSNKTKNKYTEDYKNLVIKLAQDIIPKHSSISQAIEAIKKELLNRSTDEYSIPVDTTIRGWIKENSKTGQWNISHLDFDEIESSNLTSENLQKLSQHKEEQKIPSNTDDSNLGISNLIDSDNRTKQYDGIKFAGENTSDEDQHDISTTHHDLD